MAASTNYAIQFVSSQLPLAASETSTLVPYTGGPLLLLWSDLKLFLNCVPSALGIFLPLNFKGADIRDELYPGRWQNLVSLALHVILFVGQAGFLFSLPFIAFVPTFWFLGYVGLFMLVNTGICYFLNWNTSHVVSSVPVKNEEKYAREAWIYLNGVSIGRSWLQSNCDRLSETFGRRVTGVHNPTDGVIFDLIQCLVQRNFCYSTQDVRDAYALVKKAVLDEKYKKIVFILHSQGGIEGGLIVDWLLDEVPHDLLNRLEIYTFGNAANHFNNPHRSAVHPAADELEVQARSPHGQAIRHIEHYANAGDFVSRFGVLNYISHPNRFMGRLFQSPCSGHLLNQHYLHQMFPLDKDRKASEDNEFMNMEVTLSREEQQSILRETITTSFVATADDTEEAGVAFVGDVNSPISPLSPLSISYPNSGRAEDREPRPLRVKDLSRLWRYRNGMSPTQ